MTDRWIDLLPHRPPFRLLDVVDECEPGVRVRARWQITGDEPWLAGHFPGNPIVPGVLQLESLAQAGAVAVLADERFHDRLPLFGGVDRVRFRRTVRPGDTLTLEVGLVRLGTRAGRGSGRALVEGAIACEAEILFVLAPKR